MVKDNLERVLHTLADGVRLVAVSKYHPLAELQEAYDAGQRVFGESHVQELVAKHEALPSDIEWHFIGHLQTNKVKYIAPFVGLIHSVDSVKLLKEIDKQAGKAGRVVDCLLQLHVAEEETKFGFSMEELDGFFANGEHEQFGNVRIVGLMAMATNTADTEQIAGEFENVRRKFEEVKAKYFADSESFCEISMGMSGDYDIAMKHGSTLVRVGSMIFGERDYSNKFEL